MGTLSEYSQRLNLHDGCMDTQYVWTEGGRKAKIQVRTFVSRDNPHLAVVRYAVTPAFDGPVALKVQIDAQELHELPQIARGSQSALLWMVTGTGGPTNLKAATAVRTTFDGCRPQLAYDDKPRRVTETASFDAGQGKSYTVTAFVGVYKGGERRELQQVADPLKAAVEQAVAAAEEGAAIAFQHHVAAWHQRWKTDIILEGPAADLAYHQQILRSCLFSLVQSVRPDGVFGQDCLGFTQVGWNGAVFWDNEFFLVPIYQLLHPDLALPTLRYRYDTLENAKKYAADGGYQGARYAWESRYSGLENAPEKYPAEIHIAADVVWTQWLHYQLTRDKTWLAQRAWPIIRAVADFIVSRAVRKNGRYEVLEVVGPDENAAPSTVNNDAFTNAVFRRALEIAGKAAGIVGQPPDPRWKQVEERLWQPFDEHKQIYLDHDAYTGITTKQADVEMLIFPLEVPMSLQLKRSILDYYGARLDRHGPNMSWSFHAVGRCELGDRQQAYELFKTSITPFVRRPFNQYSETAVNDKTDQLSGKATTLCCVINGFAGLRVRDDGVHFSPCLPKGWTKIRFTCLPIGSARYDVTLDDRGTVKAKLVSGVADIPIYDAQGRELTGRALKGCP